jgi:heptosyltransferase-1
MGRTRTINAVHPPDRILLIRPSALGDVCRTVPVLASLKRAWPDARIDWMVQDTFADAVRAHPALSAVVPFRRKELGTALRRGRFGPLRDYLRALREARYDLVIDAQGLFRSAFLARATGAPRRVGHAAARELAWLFYTDRERGSEGRHTVDRMLALVRTIGVDPLAEMTLHAPPEDREAAASDPRLREPYAVVAPTSRWPGKQWPIGRFDAVIERLLGDGAVGRVALVGGPSERDQCAPVLERAANDSRVIDLVGRTSVGRLMAVIERSALVLANDSAALHMAVGFDRPLVALFGPTRVDLVGPYRREADVLQHPEPGDTRDHKSDHAGRPLMERIGVDEVLDACRLRLSRACARTHA